MKSRFRSGRGIGATPDTVRDAASGRDQARRRHGIRHNIRRGPDSDTGHRSGRVTGQSCVRQARFPPRRPHADPSFDPDIQHALVPAPQDRRADFHPEFPIRPEFGHHVKHALPRTFAQHRRIHAPRTVQGTGTSLETEVVLPSRTHDFATNALQFVYFHKKPVQIPLRRLEQTAVESERSSMHAVYGARTEQHLPLLRLQIGNPLLESAKPTLQILHTYYNQSGGRTLFAASGEAKIKK